MMYEDDGRLPHPIQAPSRHYMDSQWPDPQDIISLLHEAEAYRYSSDKTLFDNGVLERQLHFDQAGKVFKLHSG